MVAFVSEAGDLRLKFWTGQIGQGVAMSSSAQRRFFKRSCVPKIQRRGDGLRKIVTSLGVMHQVGCNERFDLIFILYFALDLSVQA